MTARKRVLFVDDEVNIRITLPRILELHGFEVVTKSSVAEALATIHSEKFDVLLTDLNIGEPGDGFTVVSAMRRTQPAAITMILTGYPAFETALEAIRKQVDHYIVKPANIDELVRSMHEYLAARRPHRPQPVKRVAKVIQEEKDKIVGCWLRTVKSDPEVASVPLDDDQRTDHLPSVLATIVEMLEIHPGGIRREALHSAKVHGRQRYAQGYTVPMIMNEARALRKAIYEALQENLLCIDISYLLPDMAKTHDVMDVLIKASLQAFIDEASRPTPERGKLPEREYGT